MRLDVSHMSLCMHMCAWFIRRSKLNKVNDLVACFMQALHHTLTPQPHLLLTCEANDVYKVA